MQHDLVGVLGVVALVALAPVVADGVGEDAARGIEGRGHDAAADGRVALEAVLGVLVPEVEGAVATGRGEGAVLRVERDVVDAVDVGNVALWRVAVTLEAEVGGGVLLLDVLDRAAPLDTTHREARSVAKAAYHARLPLERALERLVEFQGVLEVDDVDVSVGRADDEEVVADVHRVDSLLGGDGADRCALSEIPVLDRLIPAAGHQHGAIRLWRLEELSALDGCIVGGDLLRLKIAAEVAKLGLLVGAGGYEFRAILQGPCQYGDYE